MSYILPQVLVYQQFKQISQTVVENLNACIIGPHYNLARYSEASEKELTKLSKVTYEGLELVSEYPYKTKGVDTSYVRVFFEDVSANYAEVRDGVATADCLKGTSIVNGVVRGDYIKSISAGFGGEAPAFEVSMPANSAFRRSSVFGGVCSGDKLYLYLNRDMSRDISDEDAVTANYNYIFKSAITGECVALGVDDLAGLSVKLPPTVESADSIGLIADRLWYVVADSDSATYLAEFKLRPQFVSKFLDMVQDDPARYAGKTLVKATTSSDDKVHIDYAEGRIYVELPALARAAEIASKLTSNPLFNKYFTLVSVSNSWAGTAEPVSDPDGGIKSAMIVEFGTLADEKELEIGDVFTHKTNGVAFTNTVYRFASAVDGTCVVAPVEDTLAFTPIDTDSSSDASQIEAVSVDDIDVSGVEFSGKKDTTYVATVVKAGTVGSGEIVFKVSDSAGLDKIYPAQVLEGISGGRYAVKLTSYYLAQLVFKASAAGKHLYEGQTFSLGCFASGASTVVGFKPMAASITEFGEHYNDATGELVVDAALGKSYGSLEIPQTLEKGGSHQWDAEEDRIVFHAGISVYDSDPETNPDARRIQITSARPFVQYRNLLDTYAKIPSTASNTNDVQTMLGAIDMDNPLAQGVYHAVLNSGEQPVRFIAVRTDDQEGYDKALEILEKSVDVYSLVPMTFDGSVLDDIQAHVNAMSGAESKHWRIAVVGFSTDKIVPVYNRAHHPLDRDYTATVEGDLVTFTASDETIARDDVWKGDKFRFAFQSDGSYKEAIVDHVVDNRHIVIAEKDPENPVISDITVPAKCEVWHDLNSDQWIDYVATKVSSFADRRMYAVFPEVLWNNGKAYPGYIGAAAIAGMISSVPPQQGLTHIEVKGFDDIPMVYSSYTRTQLNKVAEHGGLIIMQDDPGGPVYVRHQVSTRRLDGNVLTTELSVTKNLDAISYYFAEVLAPYIGKYNITPLLLQQIETTVNAGLSYLGSYNTGSGLLGPMVILDNENSKIIGIRQHETLKDHVIVSLALELPLPCNVIELYLSV